MVSTRPLLSGEFRMGSTMNKKADGTTTDDDNTVVLDGEQTGEGEGEGNLEQVQAGEGEGQGTEESDDVVVTIGDNVSVCIAQ